MESYKTVFIITSYCITSFQQECLKRCIRSIHTHHPSVEIVILNDNHSFNLGQFLNNDSEISSIPVHIELTEFPKTGECNAFLWSTKHKDSYDRFVFLHDTTTVISPIPLELKGLIFRPFWYATPLHAPPGMMSIEVESVMKTLKIGTKLGIQLYQDILDRNIYVIFGCMGIWTSEFIQFMIDHTNVLDCMKTLNTRQLRCLLERILCFVLQEIHRSTTIKDIVKNCICGDITSHTNVFTNTSLDPTKANNPYLLKVWQGR